jgi:hypothetical protein
MPTTRAPREIRFSRTNTTMTSSSDLDNDVNRETFEDAVTSCASAPAIVSATDVANCPSPAEPLEHALADATNFDELSQVRAGAEALRGYLRNIEAGLQEQNRAAKVRIRAERRIGQELARLESG